MQIVAGFRFLAVGAGLQRKANLRRRVSRLLREGFHKVVNGVFELLDAREDRAVSSTVTPNGLCKLEIGDVVLELSRREARSIVSVLGGFALLFGR